MDGSVEIRSHHDNHHPLLLFRTDDPVWHCVSDTPVEGHGAGALESAGALSAVYFLVSHAINSSISSTILPISARLKCFQPGGSAGMSLSRPAGF